MDDILQMLQDCEDRESKMTEWETNFISDIQNKVNSGYRLTERQEETLEKIWGKVTKNG